MTCTSQPHTGDKSSRSYRHDKNYAVHKLPDLSLNERHALQESLIGSLACWFQALFDKALYVD